MSKNFIPNVLVLGPGGLKGFLELGAIKFFESCNFIDEVDTIVGVSVGSIIGLLLICGYNVDQIVKEALKVELLQDFSNLDLKKIQEKLGVFSNDHFRKIIQRLVRIKFGMIPTLKQLYDTTGIKFVIISYNNSKEITYEISAENEPDIDCTEAVLLSSNIPFLLYQLKYKGDVYIDGVFGNPYPVDIFDVNGNNTLGIYIEGAGIDAESPSDSIIPYANRVIHSSLKELRKKIISTSSSRCFHVELKPASIKSNLADLQFSEDEKLQMVDDGFQQAKRQYCNFMNIEYLKVETVEEIEEIPIIPATLPPPNPNMIPDEPQPIQQDNFVYVPITPQIDEIMKDLSKLVGSNKLVIPLVSSEEVPTTGSKKLPPCILPLNRNQIDKLSSSELSSNSSKQVEDSTLQPNYMSLIEKYLSEISLLQNNR